MSTLDLFIHLETVDRNTWQGAPDDRPLNEVGARQAEALATDLTSAPVDAIYSSVAVRCQQSLQPLSAKTGLPITLLPNFQDTAEKALSEVEQIHSAHPEGRVIVCSYGDVIPALLANLAERYHVSPLARDNRRGVIFRVTYDDASGGLAVREPPADFPKS
jgi:broad specificity phosphatase PhoE